MLMLETGNAYINLLKILREEEKPYDAKVGLEAATDLRTKMKYDLGVYSTLDAKKQIGSPPGPTNVPLP